MRRPLPLGRRAVLAECGEETLEDVAAFELDLLELGRLEDQVEGDPLVELALF